MEKENDLKGQIKTTSNIPGTPKTESETRTGFVNLTYQSLIGNHEDDSLTKNTAFSTQYKIFHMKLPAKINNYYKTITCYRLGQFELKLIFMFCF